MINFIQHHKPKKKKVFLKIILPTILVLGVITASVFFWSFNHRIVKGTFELQPKISDAAGIESDTTFLLKSSNTLTSATIQKYLSVEPFIAMDVKQVSPDGKQFELIPGKPLEEEKVYSIAIDGPIAEKAQSWAYQVKAPFQIILAIPGDRHTGIPLNTGIEVKFNREIGQESSQFFEITPEVRGTFEYQNKKIIFIPQSPLSPKTIYTVHLKKGLVAKDSSDTLLEENTFSFETEDPTVQGKDEPRFEFGYDTFLEFTPESESLFEVFTHKIRSVPISLYQFANSDEFIATYRLATEDQFSWTRFHTKFSLPTAKKTLSVTIPIEKQDSLEYIRLPKKLPEGFYAIETQRKGATSLITWFQVSPLIGFSAVSATKSLIWVKDSTTKAAVSGVRITLENTTIASTDNDGIALLDTPNLLVADGGEDKNPSRPFFHLTKDGHSLVVETSSNSARPSDRWWTAVSVDRPVYLPTDRIHYWGVLKRRDGTDMKGNEITVQLRDAYSTSENEPVYTETKTTISAFSTLTGDLSYASVRPGYYELVMKSGDEVVMTQGITIRTYVKPAYFFTLEPDRRAAFVGDTVTFKVKASFYDGTPLANIKAAYSFAYGEETREVVLNESGEGSFSTRVSDSDDRFLSAMVTPAVSEEGEISAITEVLVFPSRTHLVVDPTYKDGLTEFAITTRAVDLSDATKEDAGTFEDDYLGAPQAQARVDIVVTKVTWKETLRERRYDPITKTTYPIYSYDSVRTIAQKTSVNTDAQGRAPFSWKGDDKNASYEVKFTVKDEEGRSVSVGRTAYGLISYYRESFSLGVILENTESEKYNYALNEPISLVVEREDGVALPSGSKRFLFLRAVNGHISYQLSDSSEYKDTFKEAYIPNVQIFAIWFQGSRFYDTNRWGGGIQNISLDEAEKKLSIAIKSDKDRYRPSDEVKVSLDVTGPDSKPRRAEVNIAAIDEALRVFGGSEDILGQLYRDVFTPIEFFSTHRHPLESLAEGGGCFLSGTRVLTPNGERAIEDLRVGDTVLSRASSTSKELLSTTITQSTSHIAFEYIVLNEKLRLTPNHRLWVNGSWKKAGAVAIGDILITRDGKEELVRTVERKREQRRVYNIEINPTHTFFADGYYVHNQEKGGGAGGPRKDFKDTAFFKTV
ncbi:MAG: Ig-like domain-containing protein, partial [bacterium]|nr:Ig-like domain-containing protein [bacterium]